MRTAFGFTALPDQARQLLEDQSQIANDRLVGFEEGWPVPFGFWHARNGFDTSYSAHAHASLSFLISGGPVARMDGRFAGREGGQHPDSFMLYPGDETRRYTSRGDVRLCQLYILPTFIGDVFERESTRPSTGLELRGDRILTLDPPLRRIVDDYVRRALDDALPPSRLEMETRAVLLALHLLRFHSNRAALPLPGRAGGLSRRQLATVLDYLDANLTGDVSLARLAALVGLSPRHLCTAFRNSTGLAPHRYVTRLRIDRAKTLLLGEANMATVAVRSGFSSQQHLAASFRRMVGLSPGAWRRRYRP